MNRSEYGDMLSHLGAIWNPPGLNTPAIATKALGLDAVGSQYYNPLNAIAADIGDEITNRYSSIMGAGSITANINSIFSNAGGPNLYKTATWQAPPLFHLNDFSSSYKFPFASNLGTRNLWELAIPTVGANAAWGELADKILPPLRIDLKEIFSAINPSIFNVASSCFKTAELFGATSMQDYVNFIQASPAVQEFAEQVDDDPELRRELEEIARTANLIGFLTSPTAQGGVILVSWTLMFLISFLPGHLATPMNRIVGGTEVRITNFQKKKYQSLIDERSETMEIEEN